MVVRGRGTRPLLLLLVKPLPRVRHWPYERTRGYWGASPRVHPSLRALLHARVVHPEMERERERENDILVARESASLSRIRRLVYCDRY